MIPIDLNIFPKAITCAPDVLVEAVLWAHECLAGLAVAVVWIIAMGFM